MRIVVDQLGTVSLPDPADFKSFDVMADDVAAALRALGERAVAAPEVGHVYVSISAVRELAGTAVDATWEEGFASMLTFAETHGWLDESGEKIKAHIEHP